MTSKVTQQLSRAAALDERRQKQIQNQIDTISRLLDDRDAVKEIELLQAKLAATEMKLEEALKTIRELRGESTSTYSLGLSKEV